MKVRVEFTNHMPVDPLQLPGLPRLERPSQTPLTFTGLLDLSLETPRPFVPLVELLIELALNEFEARSFFSGMRRLHCFQKTTPPLVLAPQVQKLELERADGEHVTRHQAWNDVVSQHVDLCNELGVLAGEHFTLLPQAAGFWMDVKNHGQASPLDADYMTFGQHNPTGVTDRVSRQALTPGQGRQLGVQSEEQFGVEGRAGDVFASVATPDSAGEQDSSTGPARSMHLYVEDVDKVFDQALKAGCTVVMPLQNQFWGDRYGIVSDPYGTSGPLPRTSRISLPSR